MTFISNHNPLSCDNYINAGNYFQKQLSNDSNLAIRMALVFAKIVGRGQDVLIHAGLGSVKLITSTAMALYSIPAAAFGSIPTHHKVAKEAFRHFAFALFFMADIPLSLTHILRMYPEPLCRKIQQKLSISHYSLAFDQLIDGLLDIKDSCTKTQAESFKKTYQKNNLLEEESEILQKENNLLEEKSKILQRDNEILQRDNEILQRDNEILQRDNEILQRDNEILQRDNEILQRDNV